MVGTDKIATSSETSITHQNSKRPLNLWGPKLHLKNFFFFSNPSLNLFSLLHLYKFTLPTNPWKKNSPTQTMSYTIPCASPAHIHSRRLLLHPPLPEAGANSNVPASDPSLPDPGAPQSNFDANVVLILAVLLCALVCALGLNSIVRCALRISSRVVGSEPQPGRAAATRARRKAVRAIPVVVYPPGPGLDGPGAECAICLSDLATGERVRILPGCNHGFHVKCIDRWLMAHPSCPNCRRCLFAADVKSSGCGEADAGAVTVHTIVVPLEPEGFVRDYRGVS